MFEISKRDKQEASLVLFSDDSLEAMATALSQSRLEVWIQNGTRTIDERAIRPVKLAVNQNLWRPFVDVFSNIPLHFAFKSLTKHNPTTYEEITTPSVPYNHRRQYIQRIGSDTYFDNILNTISENATPEFDDFRWLLYEYYPRLYSNPRNVSKIEKMIVDHIDRALEIRDAQFGSIPEIRKAEDCTEDERTMASNIAFILMTDSGNKEIKSSDINNIVAEMFYRQSQQRREDGKDLTTTYIEERGNQVLSAVISVLNRKPMRLLRLPKKAFWIGSVPRWDQVRGAKGKAYERSGQDIELWLTQNGSNVVVTPRNNGHLLSDSYNISWQDCPETITKKPCPQMGNNERGLIVLENGKNRFKLAVVTQPHPDGYGLATLVRQCTNLIDELNRRLDDPQSAMKLQSMDDARKYKAICDIIDRKLPVAPRFNAVLWLVNNYISAVQQQIEIADSTPSTSKGSNLYNLYL